MDIAYSIFRKHTEYSGLLSHTSKPQVDQLTCLCLDVLDLKQRGEELESPIMSEQERTVTII